jgi:hypothetical protein
LDDCDFVCDDVVRCQVVCGRIVKVAVSSHVECVTSIVVVVVKILVGGKRKLVVV